MTFRPRYGSGKPLIFLTLLLLIWIAGRMIAYGIPGELMNTDYDFRHPLDRTLQTHASAEVSPQPQSRFAAPEGVTGFRRDAIILRTPTGSQSVQSVAALWDFSHQDTPDFKARPNNMIQPAVPDISSPLRPDIYDQDGQPQQTVTATIRNRRVDRFSIDSWIFARPGGGAGPIGGQAQYGGSQGGAIMRYMLGDGSSSAPMLFARLTSALDDPAQPELALGISARPVPDIPIRIMAEQRFALDDDSVNRPSVFAVTEMAPIPLVEDIRLTSYAQAGVVGVDDPAYFFDVQLVAEKPVMRKAKSIVTVGAGLWSGGQGPIGDGVDSLITTVNRLDIGPRIALNMPIADQPVQLALDWRQRIAGNAEPGSGLALTLSTRF